MSQPTSPPESDLAPFQPSAPADVAPGASRDGKRTAVLMRAALGPVNLARYLQVFDRFDALDRRPPVWHLPAALCTLNWLVFRRLWTEAAVYALAMAALLGLCAGLWALTPSWPVGVRTGLIGSLLLLGLLAPGWMGYALVHRRLQRRVLQAATAATTMGEAVALLQRQAPSWQRLQGLVLANAALAAAVWLGASQCCAWGWPGPVRSVLAMLAPPSQTPVPEAAEAMVPVDAPVTAAPAPEPATDPAPAPATASAQPAPTLPPPVTSQATPQPPATPAASVTATPSATTTASAEPATVTSPPRSAASLLSATAPPEPPAAPEVAAAPVRAQQPKVSARHGVNVGLFAQPDNARRVFERLQQAGLPATLEVIKTAQGERSRVRVGPFNDRAEAQAAAQRIGALGLDAVVFGF